jgi:hypothetical protein
MKKVCHTGSPSVGAVNANGACASGNPISQSLELDPEKFRIDQNFAAHLNTRKAAVTVSVRRPDRQHWIYLHPDQAWRLAVGILEDKVNQRIYVVEPHIIPDVTADLKSKLLVTYATRQGTTSLWPITLPDETGRLDTYSESALLILDQYSGQ